MRYSFRELNSNFHWPRVIPINVGQVGSLEWASKNLVTGPPNSSEGYLGVAKNLDMDLGQAWMYQYYGSMCTWSLQWKAFLQESVPQNISIHEGEIDVKPIRPL